MGIIESFSNWVVRNATLTPTTIVDADGASVPFIPCSSIELGTYSSLYSIAFMACEQRKALSLGTLPCAVYRKTDEGREEVIGHPVSRLLGGMANDLMTGQDLRHWSTIRADVKGDAYWWAEWRNGELLGFWPIEGHVGIDFDRNAPEGKRVRYIVREPAKVSGSAITVPAGVYFADEIVHIKTPITKDGIKGESIAAYAAQEVGLSIDLERFYSAMLHNGNHHQGHVEVPDLKPGDAGKAQVESIRRAIEDKCGIDNAGKAPIFGYGAKWVTTQQTMKDASVIEQQQWVLQQVCRATNVPPWKVYDALDQGKGSQENARIDYATDTIEPAAHAIELALQPILDATGENLRLKFNLNALMRGDSAARGQYYREMTYSGVYTRADVRELEDMAPIDGLDKPLVPLNYGILEPDGSYTVLSSNGREPADGNQTGVTD